MKRVEIGLQFLYVTVVADPKGTSYMYMFITLFVRLSMQTSVVQQNCIIYCYVAVYNTTFEFPF